MRTWLVLLSGFLVWTAHFYGVYGVASLFPGSDLALWLTGLLTLLGLAGLIALAVPMARRMRTREEGDLARWIESFALLGIALVGIAILYQGFPALTA